jgi:flavin-dependent dehydrogenase
VHLLRRLRIDFQPDRHAPNGGILSCWGSEHLIAADSFNDPEGPGLLLDRAAFDAALKANAVAAGAEFRSTNVGSVRHDTAWHAALENGSAVAARWLVDATGRRSFLARHLGIARRRDARMAAVADTLDSGTMALGEYSSRLDRLRRVYSQRHREVYLRERRWQSMPFWSSCIQPREATV